MKKNEIALLILIVSLVALATYFLFNTLLGSAATKPVDVEVVEAFTTQVESPAESVFNSNAINPTVKVTVGEQSGQQPFTINQ